MWPLLAEDKHEGHALARSRKAKGRSRCGEKDKWTKDQRMMVLAGRRGSSRYCSCGECSGVPNGSALNNGWIVVEKEKASLGDDHDSTRYEHGE